ncbi:MAG: substrate-binding periplasmic protein [Methyloligellaceae bacterium]
MRSAFACCETRLVLNSAFGPPISSDEQTGFFDRLMAEAFRRHGVQISVDRPPAERALLNANAGIVAGDGPRIAHLDSGGHYPNLIRVPEKILDVDFVVFTNGRKLDVSQWEDLASYNVGIVRGWKILERNIIDARSLVKIKTPTLLFELLKNGRVDAVVIDRWSGLAVAEKLKLKTILVLDPPLAIRPMFLYLHRQYADLVPKIAASLKALKADGTYGRLRMQSFAHYTHQLRAMRSEP